MIKYTLTNCPGRHNIKANKQWFSQHQETPKTQLFKTFSRVEMLKKEAVSLDWKDILSTNLDVASPLG